MKPDEAVLRFLTQVGKPAEAELYLQLFRSAKPESFALIAVSSTVLRQAPGALVTDLRFLSKLGLAPVVVLGVADGDGVASASALSQRLPDDVAHRVVGVDDAAEVARTGSIAIVPLEAGDGFRRLTELASALTSRKLVFLGRRSGLQPLDRPAPSLVDVTIEYDDLARPGVLPAKQRALLGEVRTLLGAVSHRMTVSVTSPLDLLRELFTERGAGTLLRLGSRVRRFDTYAALDRARLEALVAGAFDRQLRPAFFERPAAVYVADDYRGAAAVEPHRLGGYLSKFAVGVPARGEGVGRDLFRALAADHPALFWRARAGNPIGAWYAQQSHGLQRGDTWTVYWRGLAPGDIAEAVTFATAAADDFA